MADKDAGPEPQPQPQVEKAEVQHDTNEPRRGSLRDALYSDETKRKASIAAMTENTTGESVLSHCLIASTYMFLQHPQPADRCATRPTHVRC